MERFTRIWCVHQGIEYRLPCQRAVQLSETNVDRSVDDTYDRISLYPGGGIKARYQLYREFYTNPCTSRRCFLSGTWFYRSSGTAVDQPVSHLPVRTPSESRWWAALTGAVVFTLLFLIAQPVFVGYIQRFANYSLAYGPLAIVITLVLSTWIVANILLLGGELVSYIQNLVVEQKSLREVERQHEQRDPTSPKHEPA